MPSQQDFRSNRSCVAGLLLILWLSMSLAALDLLALFELASFLI